MVKPTQPPPGEEPGSGLFVKSLKYLAVVVVPGAPALSLDPITDTPPLQPFLVVFGVVVMLGAAFGALMFAMDLVHLLREKPEYWRVVPAGVIAGSFVTVVARSLVWSMLPRWWLYLPSLLLWWPMVCCYHAGMFCALAQSEQRRPGTNLWSEAVRPVLLAFAKVLPLLVALCGVLFGVNALVEHWQLSTPVAMGLLLATMLGVAWAYLVFERAAGGWWVHARALFGNPACYLMLRSESSPAEDVPGYEDPLLPNSDPTAAGPVRVGAWSFRVRVVEALAKFGVPVAVGELQREEHDAVLPVWEIRCDDSAWQETVDAVAESVRAIVVIPGASKGVLTELAWLRTKGWYTRAIIVIPPVFESERNRGFRIVIHDNRAQMAAAWEQTRKALEKDSIRLPPFEPGLVYLPDAALSIRVARRFGLEGSGEPLATALGELLMEVPAHAGSYRDVRARLKTLREERAQRTPAGG